MTASGSPLTKGEKEISLGLTAKRYLKDGGEALNFEFPTVLLKAEISVDIILSFSWFVDFDVDLRGRKYGLQTNTIPQYFLPTIEETSENSAAIKRVNFIQKKHPDTSTRSG